MGVDMENNNRMTLMQQEWEQEVGTRHAEKSRNGIKLQICLAIKPAIPQCPPSNHKSLLRIRNPHHRSKKRNLTYATSLPNTNPRSSYNPSSGGGINSILQAEQ